MLHGLILLIGSSGRVVYEKEWVKIMSGVRAQAHLNLVWGGGPSLRLTVLFCFPTEIHTLWRPYHHNSDLVKAEPWPLSLLCAIRTKYTPPETRLCQGGLNPTNAKQTKVGVTVVLDPDYEKTSMMCALFHDLEDVR